MSDPFLGEIKMVGFTFAPRDYALCNGQILAIVQNQALYSLMGTTFGGDGTTTFALPDLRSRVPVHPGGTITQGKMSGHETVTLSANELPQHTHPFMGTISDGSIPLPSGKVYATAKWASDQTSADIYSDFLDTISLIDDTCTSAGGSQLHENRQPSLAVYFVIALQGTYPSRN